MTIGEKIKAVRLSQKMSQRTLAGNRVTPNMISSIEAGRVRPSLDTLLWISEKLKVPAGYFLSQESNPFAAVKGEKIERIRALYQKGNYSLAASMLESLPGRDDETDFLLADCLLRLGIASVRNGSLLSAKRQLEAAIAAAERTRYDTSAIRARVPLYLSVATNVQSPMLEFDSERFDENVRTLCDCEFSGYLQQDVDYDYRDEAMRAHMQAKKLLKQRRYSDCYKKLREIENAPTGFPYHAFVMFCVYGDLEHCAKELGDFESAYRYATKRMSLLEGFNV